MTIKKDLEEQLSRATIGKDQELTSEFFESVSGGSNSGKDFYLNCKPGDCNGPGQGFAKLQA